MITPEEFSYISSLYVIDCYTYQDFNIKLQNYKPFSHLILTGKNGSGKTTILDVISEQIYLEKNGRKLETGYAVSTDGIDSKYYWGFTQDTKERIFEVARHELSFNRSRVVPTYSNTPNFRDVSIHSFFKARRIGNTEDVEVPTKGNEFSEKMNDVDSTNFYVRKFKQYLVNKKIEQAFDKIEGNADRIAEIDHFFAKFTKTLQDIIEDEALKLDFERHSYEFFMTLSDQRKITFNVLPEGLSAFISIIMDLFTRIDLVHGKIQSFTYNPCGIVLIDEPETHLHLELQEQVLPLLTELFPNIQFIVATHSPAVIASIKNATIFDLTTKETRTSEETVGQRYQDLMTSHFGLDNTYSSIADGIIEQINNAVKVNNNDSDALKAALVKIATENSAYLSPTLQMELELLIVKAEAKQAVAR